jgi:hypothetical protein
METCPSVATVKGAFRSRVGTAYFAKVGTNPKDEPVMRRILKGLLCVILDDLFICDVCDGNGVPDLTRSSGKHTEHHHLIRCRAPGRNDYMSSLAEQRLLSVECLGDQNGLIGELTSTIGALTSRIGGIELLLHKLAGTANDTV